MPLLSGSRCRILRRAALAALAVFLVLAALFFWDASLAEETHLGDHRHWRDGETEGPGAAARSDTPWRAVAPNVQAISNSMLQTPLHLAAEAGHEDLLRLLIERGADASTVDDYGRPLLYAAINEGHEAMARLLIEQGADVHARADGNTMPHVAARYDQAAAAYPLQASARFDLLQETPDTLTTHELAPGLVLHFVSAPFDPAAHDVTGNGAAIDGCLVYGTDGGMPAYRLKEAYVTLRGRRLALDASCFYQNWPFDARNVSAEALGGDAYRLHGQFSDGAASFEAAWRVTPAGTVRTRMATWLEARREDREGRDCYTRLAASIEELAMLLHEWQEQQRPDGAPASPETLAAAFALLEEIDRTAAGPPCSL